MKYLASILLFTLACGEDKPELQRILPAGDATVLAVAGDFTAAGILTAVSIPNLEVVPRLIDGVVSNDPKIRKLGDSVFIINRTEHNIVKLDAKSGQFIQQIPTGDKSNPQDVAVYKGRLYVAALNRAFVPHYDLERPDQGAQTLDLAGLDADGSPDCNTLKVVGDKLVVVCGVLDEAFMPRDNGKVAIFDLRRPNDAPAVFDLPERNPFGWLEAINERELVVATVPSFADLKKGCLARILVDENRAECLISNQALGGYAGSYQSAGDDLLISVTTGFDAQDFGPLAQIVKLSAGNALETMAATAQRRFDLALCPTGHVVFAEARMGLRVIDQDGTELTSTPLDIGLAPVQNGLICY